MVVHFLLQLPFHPGVVPIPLTWQRHEYLIPVRETSAAVMNTGYTEKLPQGGGLHYKPYKRHGIRLNKNSYTVQSIRRKTLFVDL